ncbi:uncharacterized protein METZ01_LOCUS501517, partial [marine metagenome]
MVLLGDLFWIHGVKGHPGKDNPPFNTDKAKSHTGLKAEDCVNHVDSSGVLIHGLSSDGFSSRQPNLVRVSLKFAESHSNYHPCSPSRPAILVACRGNMHAHHVT